MPFFRLGQLLLAHPQRKEAIDPIQALKRVGPEGHLYRLVRRNFMLGLRLLSQHRHDRPPPRTSIGVPGSWKHTLAAPPSPITSRLSKTTLLALTEALEARFDAADWSRLGSELDLPQLGDPEMGFQRALRLGDDEYGYQVAQFVSLMESENPRALRSLAQRPALSAWLLENMPNSAQELGLGVASMPALPEHPATSASVDKALTEAGHVLHTAGAVRALNSIRTALHAYLREACSKAELTVPANASTGLLFNRLINGHPALVAIEQHVPQFEVVLGALAVAVTALNTLQKDASVTQPGDVPLGEPEVMLMVNLLRTLFDYLEARLQLERA
jgi:hypothetical protein